MSEGSFPGASMPRPAATPDLGFSIFREKLRERSGVSDLVSDLVPGGSGCQSPVGNGQAKWASRCGGPLLGHTPGSCSLVLVGR
jgi:hypothetical protein